MLSKFLKSITFQITIYYTCVTNLKQELLSIDFSERQSIYLSDHEETCWLYCRPISINNITYILVLHDSKCSFINDAWTMIWQVAGWGGGGGHVLVTVLFSNNSLFLQTPQFKQVQQYITYFIIQQDMKIKAELCRSVISSFIRHKKSLLTSWFVYGGQMEHQ